MKFLLRIAFQFARLYWWLVQPLSFGVCAFVFKGEDEVLLVRNSYRTGWFLPGGGLNRGESALEGVKRELREEVNLTCTTDPVFFGGPYFNRINHKNDHILVFVVKDWEQKDLKPRSIEIDEMRFFKLDQLPETTSPGVLRRIEEYKKGKTSSFGW